MCMIIHVKKRDVILTFLTVLQKMNYFLEKVLSENMAQDGTLATDLSKVTKTNA